MTITVLFKLMLVLLLFFVIFNLGRALYSMVKYDRDDPNTTAPMSQFLGKRLFISVVIIMVLLIGLTSGFISPNDRPY